MLYRVLLRLLLPFFLFLCGTWAGTVQGECQDAETITGGSSSLLQKSRRLKSTAAEMLDVSAQSGLDVSGSSGLHDVVGPDGVLVISLDRKPERFQHSRQHLAMGGVNATHFSATDSESATDAELRQGCTKPGETYSNPRCAGVIAARGYAGCNRKVEQAIADSHRRALVEASARQMNWTAIVEDDMVLVDPARWDQAFRKAWAKVPPETKIVRLSWCMIIPPQEDVMEIYADAGDFVLSKFVGAQGPGYYMYHPGLCTGGYMVHRDILPEMLQLFPCCIAVDGCYFDHAKSLGTEDFRGMKIMMSMAARNSREYIENATKDMWMGQHGVMYQDRRKIPSVRDVSATQSAVGRRE